MIKNFKYLKQFEIFEIQAT